ncbi:unannotated protein [freshwater metagenome]|uniref:Unannotated protein n=1 Tax=freshwater metagenome TaxID=449393 RepID=A0A6J6HHQ2_9ZZZZ
MRALLRQRAAHSSSCVFPFKEFGGIRRYWVVEKNYPQITPTSMVK